MPINMTGDMQVIDRAQADGCVCLLGTADANGHPQISPKGSMQVLDATHLAYWERSARSAADNVRENPRVVVYYRNSAKTEQFPKGAVWRFYGVAQLLTAGSERDKVWSRTIAAEQEKDPERKGAAVIIAVDRITDLGGRVIQE
jgi:predicted pyridoxine 5'-phosphate oxidase superfamily flavin-nucleotide-binding protein